MPYGGWGIQKTAQEANWGCKTPSRAWLPQLPSDKVGSVTMSHGGPRLCFRKLLKGVCHCLLAYIQIQCRNQLLLYLALLVQQQSSVKQGKSFRQAGAVI